ncbi:hypothetical protein B0H12DRAFT_1239290 [Mycena haematopus]|nr:hypothetical protein B0H12DRAFT_1239290 [Mycena haematopus]
MSSATPTDDSTTTEPPAATSALYAHARLPCGAGYSDLPNICTEMTFDLRQLPRITSRVVRLQGHTLELWSPNSTQTPFLPGERRSDYVPITPLLFAERRYDGHTGKHDCLFVPQYGSSQTMHWPFIRRANMVPLDDDAYAAFAPLYEEWEVDPANRYRGRFNPAFVDRLSALRRELDERIATHGSALSSNSGTWATRPRYTNEVRAAALLGVRSWEDALDLGTAFQRGLREKEGWVTMMDVRTSRPNFTVEQLRGVAMPLADERYIGLWVNGAREGPVLNLMLAKIPCFIVHEYPSGTPARDEVHAETPSFPDLLGGTEVSALISNGPYQRIARNNPVMLDSITPGDDGRTSHTPSLFTNEMRSSSMWLESLEPHIPLYSEAELVANVASPRGRAALPSFSRSVALSTVATANPAPANRVTSLQEPPPPSWTANNWTAADFPPLTRAPSTAAPSRRSDPIQTTSSQSSAGAPSAAAPQAETGPLPVYWPSAPNAKQDKFRAEELERRVIDAARVPWVVPPPIHKAWGKKYQHYELDFLNDDPAWIYRGKGNKPGTSSMWVDRQLGRYLHFGRLAVEPGVLDEGRFCAPVPRHPFIIMDGEVARNQKPSRWMYPKEKLAPHEVGKRAAAPSPLRLPLLHDSGEREEGKGKGKARDSDVEEEDDSDDDVGMNLDVPLPPIEPTNIVTIQGLDDAISAIMFRQLAADLLFRAGASPLAILHGQGRMWLRLPDATQGRRGFGSVGQLATGLTVGYRRNEEFDEAVGYSRDLWEQGTLDDAEDRRTPSPPPAYEPESQEQYVVGVSLADSAPAVVELVGAGSSASAYAAPAPPDPLASLPEEDVLMEDEPSASPNTALTLPDTLPVSETVEEVSTTASASSTLEETTPGLSFGSVPLTEMENLTDPLSPNPAVRMPPPPRTSPANARPRRPLLERLSDARPSASNAAPPLAQRLAPRVGPPRSSAIAAPLVQRLAPRETPSLPSSDLPLLNRIGNPEGSRGAKRRHAPPLLQDNEEEEEQPSANKRKVRRGRRSGCKVKEQERLYAEKVKRLLDQGADVDMATEEDNGSANGGSTESAHTSPVATSSRITLDNPMIDVVVSQLDAIEEGEIEEVPAAGWGDDLDEHDDGMEPRY